MSSMRIGLYGYSFGKTTTRISQYATSLTLAAFRQHPEVDFILYVHAKPAIVLPKNCTLRVLERLSEKQFVNKIIEDAEKDHLNFLHFFHLPKKHPENIPYGVTIHDLDLIERSWLHFFAYRKTLKLLRSASFIATSSDSLRKEISRIFSLPLDSLRVITGSVSESFSKVPELPIMKEVMGRLRISSDFLLCVGKIRKSSNVEAVLNSFARLIKDSRFSKTKLVIAGRAGFQKNTVFYTEKELRQLTESHGVQNQVIVTGVMKERELNVLYHTTKGMISLTGGLYFPGTVLEAMKAGAPVCAPHTPMYREIMPEHTLYYEPAIQKSLTYAMTLLMNSSISKEGNVREGLERALNFSWNESAQTLYVVWHKVIEKNTKKQ